MPETATKPNGKATKVIPPCPECGMSGFKGMQGRAIHRKYAHGVAGSNPNTISYHKLRQKRAAEQQQATQPPQKRKYTRHTKAVVKVKANGATHEEWQAEILPQNQAQEIERQIENHVSYAFGLIASKLESYTSGVGIPYDQIASRVGELLLYSTGRKVLGTEHRMSSLWRKTS